MPGEDPANWVDTEANNSLSVNDALFAVFDVGGDAAFGTSSTATNIHSHYVDAASNTWTNYRYTGRMMITAASGGTGVTFLSAYANADTYYRLRRYQGSAANQAFHVSPHGTTITSGTANTGIVPTPGLWYRFVIEVEDEDSLSRTVVRVKVWAEGDGEPSGWQAECYDENLGRLTFGTVGVWSMGPGNKYWDDLEVVTLGGN